MIKLYSSEGNKFLKPIFKSETELNSFLCESWSQFFPQFLLIKSEFVLEGNVRSKGGSGRVDILAFNPNSKKFVVFELKKESDKNIRNQVSDYKDFIEDNFAKIYLLATQKYKIQLPKFDIVSEDSIEVVMIAQSFTTNDVQKARKSNSEITLIKYMWFENQLLLIDYLNNDPDDIIEKENSLKIKRIKSIINSSSEYSNSEAFLYGKEEAKRLFKIFYESLSLISLVSLEVQSSKIKIGIGKETFSVIGYAGKTGRKCFLVINTNINSVASLGSIVDDRVRPGKKKKGSLGTQRYEVFITKEHELFKLLSIIKANYLNQKIM